MTHDNAHAPIGGPVTLDTIMRARIIDLLALHGISQASAARRAGWATGALYRLLSFEHNDPHKYRQLSMSKVDILLAALGMEPSAVLQPILLSGDDTLLRWVASRTPMDPMPSRAHWSAQCDGSALHDTNEARIVRLQRQGLLTICGDPDDTGTWYLRLTPRGQLALS